MEGQSYGLKWYKFIIYFGLFYYMLGDLISGINNISGLSWQELGYTSNEVAFAFPSIHNFTVFYGVVQLCFVIFCAHTWMRLKSFKINAHKEFILYLIVRAIGGLLAAGIVMPIITGPTGGEEGSIASAVYMVWTIAISAIMIVINIIYFKHREYLFVN